MVLFQQRLESKVNPGRSCLEKRREEHAILQQIKLSIQALNT